MRESLFEKLKKRDLSFVKELRKIYNLLNQSYTDTYSYYSRAFKSSPYNVFFEDIDDALCNLIEIDKDYRLELKMGFKYLINHIIDIQADLTLDSFLDYLEFFKSLLEYKSRDFDTNARQIALIVLNDCEKLGYTFKKDDESKTYKVMIKNPLAEAVALSVKHETRDLIYAYLSLRSGKVVDKRATMKMLIDDIEGICQKYKNIEDYNKVQNFMQCVRHAKDSPKGKVLEKQYPFYYINEEYWLDKLFELVIGILSFTNNKGILKEIREMEKAGE